MRLAITTLSVEGIFSVQRVLPIIVLLNSIQDNMLEYMYT